MTDAFGSQVNSDRTRLNIGLWLAALVAAAVVLFLGSQMWHLHSGDGGTVLDRAGNTLIDKHDQAAAGLGADVGAGVVTSVPEAPSGDQQRLADILTAGTRMVTSFLNVDWKNPDASFAAVRAASTGAFRTQYDKSTAAIAKLARRMHSTERGEVIWAGYVAGDADSATVIAVTSGTVASKATKYQPHARFYRIQLDLQKVGQDWLVNNLQFVS
ncbi:hypothetical protein GCM10028801_22640 [Nocardioides maradonensis]